MFTWFKVNKLVFSWEISSNQIKSNDTFRTLMAVRISWLTLWKFFSDLIQWDILKQTEHRGQQSHMTFDLQSYTYSNEGRTLNFQAIYLLKLLYYTVNYCVYIFLPFIWKLSFSLQSKVKTFTTQQHNTSFIYMTEWWCWPHTLPPGPPAVSPYQSSLKTENISFSKTHKTRVQMCSNRLNLCCSLRIAALFVSLRKRNFFSFSCRLASTSHTTKELDWRENNDVSHLNTNSMFKMFSALSFGIKHLLNE